MKDHLWLTPDQVTWIRTRIAEIDSHFAYCCAFQMDKCHMAEEYDKLHILLEYATPQESKGS